MSCNKGYFVGGLFVGTIIGGALGILLAPTSGEETRRKIKDGAQDVYKRQAFGRVKSKCVSILLL